MKVTLSKADIQRISQVSAFAGRNTSLEALTYLRFHADGNVSAEACNLTISAKIALAGQIEREGTILLPTGLLDVLKQEELVQVSSGPKMLVVKAGTTEMRRKHQHDVEDFPQTTIDGDVTQAGSVYSDNLKQAIQHLAGIPDKGQPPTAEAVGLWSNP